MRLMKIIVLLFFLIIVTIINLFSPSLVQASFLDLEYIVTISDPSNHTVTINLNISNLNSSTLTLARFIDEGAPNISNLTVTDNSGVPLTISDVRSLVIVETMQVNTSGSSNVRVTYDVDLSFLDMGGNVSPWILDYTYGMVESQRIFYQIIGSQMNSIRIDFDLPIGWSATTRFQDSAGVFIVNPDDVYTVFDSDKEFPLYIHGPMAFGDFDVYTRIVGNINVRVAFYSENDIEESRIAERVFSTIDHASNTVGKLPVGNSQGGFVYVFHDYTHGHIHSGFHEFGQITPMDVGISKWRGMAHMIFHNWFMGNQELPLWKVLYPEDILGEGIVQYYALNSSGETGIWTKSQVNDHLMGWYNDYTNYILGTEYDVPLTSDEMMYFPNDPLPSLYGYGISWIIWYEKVALVLYVINWKIEDVSSGEKSLHDVWHHLYEQNPGSPKSKGDQIYLSDLLEATNQVTGQDFSDVFDAYVFGAQPLPFMIVDDVLTVDVSLVPKTTPLPEDGGDDPGAGDSDGGGGGGCFINSLNHAN